MLVWSAAFQIVEKKDGDAGQWTRMIPLLRFLIASVLALDFACSEYAHSQGRRPQPAPFLSKREIFTISSTPCGVRPATCSL
jgi:hypothetical protein